MSPYVGFGSTHAVGASTLQEITGFSPTSSVPASALAASLTEASRAVELSGLWRFGLSESEQPASADRMDNTPNKRSNMARDLAHARARLQSKTETRALCLCKRLPKLGQQAAHRLLFERVAAADSGDRAAQITQVQEPLTRHAQLARDPERHE